MSDQKTTTPQDYSEPPDCAFRSPEDPSWDRLRSQLESEHKDMQANSIADQLPETLEAFGKDGMHVGSARRMKSGRWHVTFTGVVDEAQARRLLESFGAVKIESQAGPKQ